MRFKTLLAALLGLLLVLGLTAACAQKEQPGGTAPKVPAKLKIGSLINEENLPILVAQEKGYFTAENLQVELVPMQSPVELQSAFQSGELDGMMTDIMIALMLKGAGVDLRITSIALGSTPQEGRFAIVAAPNSDIMAVQDLKGKSIGISSNSIIEYVTDGILAQAGMSPSDVEKITLAKIPVRVEMLLNNQIDAITVPDPHISNAVARGARVIADDTTGENLSQSVYVMTGQALSEKTDAIAGFYRAYARAAEDINAGPDQFRGLLVSNCNIPEQIAGDYQVQHYPAPQLPAEKNVNDVLTWLKAKDLLKGDLKYADVVYPFTIFRRLDCILEPAQEKVLETYNK
ncbi:MAG: putative aliphatic sulfonates-binding protein precursor [Firmicutes bacterium ADurb.Bin456]|nr:MAG: putative aliphatic sulfonates-binding protein precursor [Firmicutes bacterium ADurb.Bin456]